MKKASVTIVFSLVTSILLSAFLILWTGVSRSMAEAKLEWATEMALYSAFAEYHRGLLEEFDLFFIDSGYLEGEASLEKVSGHIRSYLEDNLNAAPLLNGKTEKVWNQWDSERVQIKKVETAVDDGGAVLKKQAIQYMKESMGLSFLPELEYELLNIRGMHLLERDTGKESEKITEQIQSLEEGYNAEKADEEKIQVQNPADAIHRLRGKGILAYVWKKDHISTVQIDLPSTFSHRTKIYLDQASNEENASIASSEELFFNEYLLKKFANCILPKERAKLQYQVEYIIEGKDSDYENLKAIAERLLKLREGANLISLFADQGKIAQADAMAATLTAAAAIPQLQPLLKYSLLLAWSYAESILDVRALFEERSIPLLKKSDEWKLDLSQIFQFEEYAESEKEIKGLNYAEYLRILLYLMDGKEKCERAIDMIELDIRKQEPTYTFCMEGAVSAVDVQIQAESKAREFLMLDRKYRYLPIQKK